MTQARYAGIFKPDSLAQQLHCPDCDDARDNAMTGADSIFGIHGQALEMRARRLELIASNIANAATPNYKARDIDFAAALGSATEARSFAITNPQHLQPGNATNGGAPLYRIPVQASLDGNTVELATEQTAFAENAVRYQTTLSLLNGRISTLMSALKGE
jgi:flagellar basal-body rod protein FlgB